MEYFDFECPFCKEKFFHKTKSLKNRHINHCGCNPDRKAYVGHSWSDEDRKRISERMKKAFKEGRATGWHKRKTGTQSYPEKWFESVIENEFFDKNYESEFHVGKYRLDFA